MLFSLQNENKINFKDETSEWHPAAFGQPAFRVMYATVLQGQGAQPVIFIYPIKASVSLRCPPVTHLKEIGFTTRVDEGCIV